MKIAELRKCSSAELQRQLSAVVLVFLALCAGAGAQTTAPSPAASTSQTTAKQQPDVATVLDHRLTSLERDVVPAADAMPDDKFNFAPGDVIKFGDFKGVKTFAQQVTHIGATNDLIAASLLGQPSPLSDEESDLGPKNLKTKAEIIAYLKDSFANLHKAFALTTNDNLTENIRSPFDAKRQTARLNVIIVALAHTNDHYGQMVEYLRMNGIIPPASRPQPQQ
jgi:uncharacterized damage-inducible protein DinB